MCPTGRRFTTEFRMLKRTLNFKPVMHREDYDWWLAENGGKFSVKTATKALRQPENTTDWHKLVWSKKSVPRFAFILWLVCTVWLNTKEKLKNWGV